MVWRGKGRSGIGDQYLTDEPMSGASYEDWDGVSPNGRQFKNAFTQEVRDLSGAEYWKARKANNPTECDLENHFNNNGSANIKAYKDDEKPKRATAKKKSAFERANLADAHYSRLEQLSIELDEELESGILSLEDWTCARRQLDKRLDVAWQRVCKAKNWNPEEKDEEIYNLCLPEMQQKKVVDKVGQDGLSFGHSVVESLSETNCLKIPLKKLLTAKEKMIRILHIIKQ